MFLVNDARKMPFSDGEVHHIFTSPPYNVGIQYDSWNDLMAKQEYWDFNRAWIQECWRVMEISGRLGINIPNMGNSESTKKGTGLIPILPPMIALVQEVGFTIREVITWVKTNTDDLEQVERNFVGGGTAWGCYDDDTRVLTMGGLKYFRDVNIETDLFATINPKSKEVEYQRAFDYIEKPYDGEMAFIHNESVNLFITPNHNMAILRHPYKIDQREIEILPLCSIPLSNYLLPHASNGDSSGTEILVFELPPVKYGKRTKKIIRQDPKSIPIKMDTWLKFLGVFLTDGNVYYSEKDGVYNVSIYQNKIDSREKIREMLEDMPFKFRFKESKGEFITSSKQLAGYLSLFGNKNERKFPEFIYGLSSRQRSLFIDWMMMGDGCYKGTSERYYVTSSPFLRDCMANLFTMRGSGYSIETRPPPTKERTWRGKRFAQTKTVYLIHIHKSKYHHIGKGEIEMIPYRGKVYCVSVPNRTLLVERGGKFTWCGNSWKSASNPFCRSISEFIIVAHKEKPKLQWKGESDITRDEYLRLTRNVWLMPTRKDKNHPAAFHPMLPFNFMRLFTYVGDVVLDPFSGSGTTVDVARAIWRNGIGLDISPNYTKEASQKEVGWTKKYLPEYIK